MEFTRKTESERSKAVSIEQYQKDVSPTPHTIELEPHSVTEMSTNVTTENKNTKNHNTTTNTTIPTTYLTANTSITQLQDKLHLHRPSPSGSY